MANIIVIIGTPGTGKTTVAKKLMRKLRYTHVEFSRLVKAEKLYIGRDTERRALVVDEERVRKRIESLSQSSKGLVLSTHQLGKAVPKSLITVALVLRLDPVILYGRLRRRGWTKRKAWENAEAEIVDVSLQDALSLLGKSKVRQIDTTRKSAEKVVEDATHILERKRRARFTSVNWLAMYDPVELERTL